MTVTGAGTSRRADDAPATSDEVSAGRLASEIAQQLGLSPDYVLPAYEDPWRIIRDEQNLPLNVDPLAEDTKSEPARRRLGDRLTRGLGNPAGYVLPLKARARAIRADIM